MKKPKEIKAGVHIIHTHEDTLTIEEAAGLARVSERTVYNWLSEGKLPAVKLCGKWLIEKQDLFMSGIGRYGDISIKGLHTLSFVDLHVISMEMGALLSRYAEEGVQGVCDFAHTVLAEMGRTIAGRPHHESLEAFDKACSIHGKIQERERESILNPLAISPSPVLTGKQAKTARILAERNKGIEKGRLIEPGSPEDKDTEWTPDIETPPPQKSKKGRKSKKQ